VKPETLNSNLELTDSAKPRKTQGLMGMGPDLACQDAAGQVFGLVWSRTDLFLQSKPRPLAGYLDPSPTPRLALLI